MMKTTYNSPSPRIANDQLLNTFDYGSNAKELNEAAQKTKIENQKGAIPFSSDKIKKQNLKHTFEVDDIKSKYSKLLKENNGPIKYKQALEEKKKNECLKQNIDLSHNTN